MQHVDWPGSIGSVPTVLFLMVEVDGYLAHIIPPPMTTGFLLVQTPSRATRDPRYLKSSFLVIRYVCYSPAKHPRNTNKWLREACSLAHS